MEQRPNLSTDRLILRAHDIRDVDEQFNLYRDPAVQEYIRGLPVIREDVWHRFLRYAGHWSLFGYGMFAVFERGSGCLIGEVGLAQFQRGLGADFDAAPEAAWLFAGGAHGRGYAIEAMETLMGWFDGTRPEERCVCIIDTQNTPSVRLAARLDFRAYGDPEMSQNVLIEECVFDQGDDAVSVKAGREDDAWRLATPSRNIVMRNCLVKNGHQLMAIGSEISGGIENVFVDQCRVEQEPTAKSALNNLLFVKTNERRGGFVRNIYLTNISSTAIAGGVLSVDTDVLYQWRTLVPTYERKLTPIEGLHVRNVMADSAKFRAAIKGEKKIPVRNVTLDNVHVGEVTGEAVTTVNVEGFLDR